MASAFGISALSVRLLLLAMLALTPTGAGADEVTWRKCKQQDDRRGRVLDSSLDYNATTLDLRQCHITEIRGGDFGGLPNLEKIIVDRNGIVRVDLAAFSPVSKLTQLDISGNELRVLPIFDDPSLFPSLVELSLKSNQLTIIQHANTFSGCIKLDSLHLDNNLIEYIHPEVFKPLTALSSITLSNNKIAYIPKRMFVNNKKLKRVHLYMNRISYLPFNLVTELSNAGVHLTTFYFSYNPWYCACLLELMADVKTVGVTNYDQYHGTQPVCRYYGAYPCSRHPPGLLRAPPRAPDSSPNTSL